MRRAYWMMAIWLVISACQTTYLSRTEIDYEQVSPIDLIEVDDDIEAVITPYREELSAIMDEVIGELEVTLVKERPECNMGNWLADMIYEEAILLNDGILDFAVQNQGGLRIPTMAAGPITRGEVLEVMPFDNKLSILTATGKEVQAFLDHIASSRGWPVSRQLKFKIKDKKAVDIELSDQPIDHKKTYHFAVPDYIAGGGSGAHMLKELARKDYEVLLRDFFVEHIIKDTQAGLNQYPMKEGRIINLDHE